MPSGLSKNHQAGPSRSAGIDAGQRRQLAAHRRVSSRVKRMTVSSGSLADRVEQRLQRARHSRCGSGCRSPCRGRRRRRCRREWLRERARDGSAGRGRRRGSSAPSRSASGRGRRRPPRASGAAGKRLVEQRRGLGLRQVLGAGGRVAVVGARWRRSDLKKARRIAVGFEIARASCRCRSPVELAEAVDIGGEARRTPDRRPRRGDRR